MNWKTGIQKLSTSASVGRAHALLTRIPGLRTVVKKFTRTAIPRETRLWLPISAGLGKGLWVHLDPRFEMEYADGKYEPRIQQVLSKHLEPGSVLYDVGAHIGIVSLFAARLVGTKGTVFAFEADPDNAERIKEHVRRNMLDQIQVVPQAIWSSTGRLRFERASPQSSRNQGTLATESAVSSENTIEVDAIALDDFARGHVPPTLIKIDVEGSEAAVLQGSEEISRSAKPILVCEIHHEQASTEVTHWLQARGYTFEWLESSMECPRHLFAKYVG